MPTEVAFSEVEAIREFLAHDLAVLRFRLLDDARVLHQAIAPETLAQLDTIIAYVKRFDLLLTKVEMAKVA